MCAPCSKLPSNVSTMFYTFNVSAACATNFSVADPDSLDVDPDPTPAKNAVPNLTLWKNSVSKLNFMFYFNPLFSYNFFTNTI